MFNFLQKLAGYKKPTAADYNKLVDRINQLSKITGSGGVSVISGPMGTNIIGGAVAASGAGIKIFEVQDQLDTPADGIYKCYQQTLDATEWDDTAGDDRFDNKEEVGEEVDVEVFNLFENNCSATYKEALATGDRIAAWKWTDDEGTSRWVGVPITHGSPIRMARTTAAAGATQTIVCNLAGQDGVEITSGLGSGITVGCKVSGDGNLNAAIPRLADDDDIFVVNLNGEWWCTTVFQTSEDCDCYDEA